MSLGLDGVNTPNLSEWTTTSVQPLASWIPIDHPINSEDFRAWSTPQMLNVLKDCVSLMEQCIIYS
jgi:hypothetical protein